MAINKKVGVHVTATDSGFESTQKKLAKLTASTKDMSKQIDKNEKKGIITHKQANVQRSKLARQELSNRLALSKTQTRIDSDAARLSSKIQSKLSIESINDEIKSKRKGERENNKIQAEQERDAKINARNQTIAKDAQSSGIDVNSYLRGMRQAGFEYNKQNQIVDKAGRTLVQLKIKNEDYNRTIVNSARQTRRFQGEMLSTMFAGMALTRVFDGMVRSSLDLWGVTELTAAAMDVTMIPIMETLSPIVYDLLGAFMELPEGIQTAIGAVSLFAWTAGQVISGLAMTSLAFPSFGKALEDWVFKSGNLAKAAGLGIKIGVSLFMAKEAYDDLNDGKGLAAIGDALIGVGMWTMGADGGITLGIGIVAKLIGDEDFATGLFKIMIKTGNAVSNILSAAIKSGLTMGLYKPDIDDLGIGGLVDAYQKAVEQVNIETGGKGLTGSFFGIESGIMFPEITTEELRKEIDLLNAEFEDDKSSEEYKTQLDEIHAKYPKQVEALNTWVEAIAGYKDSTRNELNEAEQRVSDYVVTTEDYLDSLEKTWTSTHIIITKHVSEDDDTSSKDNNNHSSMPLLSAAGFNPFSLISSLFSNDSDTSKDVQDAIITPSGTVNTSPDDYIIATKDPSSLGGNANVSMNVTYNVVVQDKRELEKILRDNNQKLTEDVRRLVSA